MRVKAAPAVGRHVRLTRLGDKTADAIGRRVRLTRFVAVSVLPWLVSGCDKIWPRQPDRELPPIEQIREAFHKNGLDAEIAYNGNVVEIRVVQPADQLRRGGSLWARVGPWVYVFNPGTRLVFDTWPGVAAVRVITSSENREVARATLRNGTLSDVLWRRSLNILGRALKDGTRDPGLLQQLAEWGERYADYQYSPEFVPNS